MQPYQLLKWWGIYFFSGEKRPYFYLNLGLVNDAKSLTLVSFLSVDQIVVFMNGFDKEDLLRKDDFPVIFPMQSS